LVAERRLTLARPFKAGIANAESFLRRGVTIDGLFHSSLTRSWLAMFPALKGRAKVNRRSATKHDHHEITHNQTRKLIDLTNASNV
jgi:hypothetical protein